MALNRNHKFNLATWQIRILNSHRNRTINVRTRGHDDVAVLINFNRNVVAVFVLSSHLGVCVGVVHLDAGRLLLVRRLHGVRVIGALHRSCVVVDNFFVAINRNFNRDWFVEIRIINRHSNRAVNVRTRGDLDFTGLRIDRDRDILAVFVLCRDLGVLTRVGNLHTGGLLVVGWLNGLRIISTLNRSRIVVLALLVAFNVNFGYERGLKRRVINGDRNRPVNISTRGNNNVAALIQLCWDVLAVFILRRRLGLLGRVLNLDTSGLRIVGWLDRLLAGLVELQSIFSGRLRSRIVLRLAVRIVRVGARIDFILIGNTVAVGIRFVRIRRFTIVLRTVELFLIGQAVTVGIRVVRVGTRSFLFLIGQAVTVGITRCILDNERERLRADSVTISDLYGDVKDSVTVLGHNVSGVLVISRGTGDLAVVINGDSLRCTNELVRGVGQLRTVSRLGRNLDRVNGLIGPGLLALNLFNDQILRSRLLITCWDLNNDGVGELFAVDSSGNRQLKDLSRGTRFLLRNGDSCGTLLIEGHVCALRGLGGICRERGALRQGIHGLTVEGQLRRDRSGGVLAVHGKALQRWVVNAVGVIGPRSLRLRRRSSFDSCRCRLGRLLTILRCHGLNLVIGLELFVRRNVYGESARLVRILSSGDFLTRRQGHFHLAACRSRNGDLRIISLYRSNGRGLGRLGRGIGCFESTTLGALAIRGLRNEGVLRVVFKRELG